MSHDANPPILVDASNHVFEINSACAAGLVRLYFATRFYESNDTSYFFSVMALCSLCETSCAIFTPKAMGGLQKSRALSELRKYMTLKSHATYTNNSDAFRETMDMPHLSKPTGDRLIRSGGNSNQRKYSDDSDKALYQQNPV